MDDPAATSGKKEKTTALSIDRAAFLLLRVKKAFKKKRQQRKEKQQAAQLAAAFAEQSYAGKVSKKCPPPLLRSRTLPSIIISGITILQAQIDPNSDTAPNLSAQRRSLQPRTPPRASLTSDDSGTEGERRRSAGSWVLPAQSHGPKSSTSSLAANDYTEPHVYALDNIECQSDGTVIVRIPTSHVTSSPLLYESGGCGGNTGCGGISANFQHEMGASTTTYSAKHNQIVTGGGIGGSGAPLLTTNTSNNSTNLNSTGFNRFTRFLNQSTKHYSTYNQARDDSPRRLSWERKDRANSCIPRSASIDSVVEAVWSAEDNAAEEQQQPPRPPPNNSNTLNTQYLHVNYTAAAAATPSRRESFLSPSPGRKKSLRLSSFFSAVEHGHLEKARTIIESTDVNVNSVNSDGLSSLDVAVLSNNRSMTKMLLLHGAGENVQWSDSLGDHLNVLLREAEQKVQELSSLEHQPTPQFNSRASFANIIGNAYGGPNVSGCTGSEIEKQIGLWERRVKGLKRMLLGWDQTRPPDAPNSVLINVINSSTVIVRIYEPVDGPLGTKFKVQWSTKTDFSKVMGECEITEWASFLGTMGGSCRICDLTHGRRYYFRACLGNMKGWGSFKNSIPESVTPSSWRDIDNREYRFEGKEDLLDELLTTARLAGPDNTLVPTSFNTAPSLAAGQKKVPKKKTTIKQLFSAASKFQRNLKRGIYLASIIYHEDKLLVTNEDFIPVIEIDETYPSCLHTDFHWLMKVACSWEDIKAMRNDMEKNTTSTTHFRLKLLTAATNMQSALCLTDLGQFYYKPIRDTYGTMVLCCVNSVKSSKSVSSLNSRWMPLNKIFRKMSTIHETNSIHELLVNSVQEQINYHYNLSTRLPKGLYLGFLKMQCSVDQIHVVVPAKTPNVLPHTKIRENPHVSAEEWEILKGQKSLLTFGASNESPTDCQKLFMKDVAAASRRIFKLMDISPEESQSYRLYDVEVIELNADVSFLIICPPAESSCAVSCHKELLLQRDDLISISVQTFEVIHLRLYQSNIIQKYSRLSCLLELENIFANHSHREAFSTVELQAARKRLVKLQELTGSMNLVWKSVRWLMDVISFARDRASTCGLALKHVFDLSNLHDECNEIGSEMDKMNQQHLRPPNKDDKKLVKNSTGRGSWPGLTLSEYIGTNCISETEHSKSEQQLYKNNYLSATPDFDNSRKNSADSGNSACSINTPQINYQFSVFKLQPSRSEDTLNTSKKSLSTSSSNRKRTTTVNVCPTTRSPSYLTTEAHSFPSLSPSKSKHSGLSLSASSSTADVATAHSQQDSSSTSFSMIQVFAAYETGLANGTSLKLNITIATTAREVVNLVVKQLNMTAALKGRDAPIYGPRELDQFCLVAIIGARERCLRDDFKPLQLQNPWRKGRLYVRKKADLLAAIEHSSIDAQLV